MRCMTIHRDDLVLATGAGADEDEGPRGAGALTSRKAGKAGAAGTAGADGIARAAGCAFTPGAGRFPMATNCDAAGGGTSVGNGASLTDNTGAGSGRLSTTADCAGVLSFELSSAQPPTVAASDAAVISILTPGTPVAGFLAGGMCRSPKN